MFLILYENQIITLEKKYKISSMWKKMRPKSVVLQSQEKLQVLEKKFFRKKFLAAYLCRYDFQNCVWKFFLNKWVLRNLSLGDFEVPKNCSSQ